VPQLRPEVQIGCSGLRRKIVKEKSSKKIQSYSVTNPKMVKTESKSSKRNVSFIDDNR